MSQTTQSLQNYIVYMKLSHLSYLHSLTSRIVQAMKKQDSKSQAPPPSPGKKHASEGRQSQSGLSKQDQGKESEDEKENVDESNKKERSHQDDPEKSKDDIVIEVKVKLEGTKADEEEFEEEREDVATEKKVELEATKFKEESEDLKDVETRTKVELEATQAQEESEDERKDIETRTEVETGPNQMPMKPVASPQMGSEGTDQEVGSHASQVSVKIEEVQNGCEWWYKLVTDQQEFKVDYQRHQERMKTFLINLPKVSLEVLEYKITQKMTRFALEIAQNKVKIEKNQDSEHFFELSEINSQELEAGRDIFPGITKDLLQNFDQISEKPFIHDLAVFLMKGRSVIWRLIFCFLLTISMAACNYFVSIKELVKNQNPWILAGIKTAFILGGGITSCVLYFSMNEIFQKTVLLSFIFNFVLKVLRYILRGLKGAWRGLQHVLCCKCLTKKKMKQTTQINLNNPHVVVK